MRLTRKSWRWMDTVRTIDNAKVYVSSDFSTARESGGDTVDFV